MLCTSTASWSGARHSQDWDSCAGLLALLRPLVERSPGGWHAAMVVVGFRLVERLASLAALGVGLLGLNYLLLLDGLPGPWFIPSIAFRGSIDIGIFLTAASVVLVVSQFMCSFQPRGQVKCGTTVCTKRPSESRPRHTNTKYVT